MIEALAAGRRARTHRVGRAAVLRVRHRRLVAGGARRRLVDERLGPERRAVRHRAERRRGRGGRRRLARSTCSDCPRAPAWASRPGATMASFTGLAAGRHALLERAGWDVERDGLFGAPAFPVVVGAEAHVTIHRGAPDAGARTRARDPRGHGRAGADARGPAGRGPGRTRPTGARLRAVGQREHRRVRPATGDRRGRRARTAAGCTSTGRSGCGRRSTRHGGTWSTGIGARRLVDDRFPQVAERALRLGAVVRARRRRRTTRR